MMMKKPFLDRYLYLVLATLSLGASTQAASVSLFGVGKTQSFNQSNETTVTPNTDQGFSFSAIALPSGSDVAVMAQAPGSAFPQIFLQEDETILSYEDRVASATELDSRYPPGPYSFTIVAGTGFNTAQVTLGPGTYPAAPQFTGFAAAQAIDGTKAYTLTWKPFAGAGPNDLIRLRIEDSNGDPLYQTGLPGEANALSATAESASIPANILTSEGNVASLSFVRVASRDTTALPGAVALTFYSSETSMPLTVNGGSTPGGNTDRPALLSVSPANNATGVPTNSPVVFRFSKPMAAVQSISWPFANSVPANFTYTWSADAQTLTAVYKGGFPANTAVVWAVDPSGFKDTAGNELAQTANLTGFFLTAGQSGPGGSTNGPCGGGTSTNTSVAQFSVAKFINYVQTTATAPAIDSESPPSFIAAIKAPTGVTPTNVTLTLPNGTVKTLEGFFGQFFISEEFATQEALDAAYPSGLYTATLKSASGDVTAKATLSNSYPPTPQLTNYDVVQKFDPSAGGPFNWQPYTGAGPTDSIVFLLHNSAGTSFYAPDACVPRELPNTAVTINVPKGIFTSTAGLEGSLSFYRGTFDTNSVPGVFISAALMKDTKFKIGGTVPVGTQPVLQNLTRLADGSVRFQVKATAGTMLQVEGTSDLPNWSPVTSAAVPASGILDVSDPKAIGQSRRFYRAK